MNSQPPLPGVGIPTPPLLRCYNPTCRHTWYQRAATPPLKCPGCQSHHWYDPKFGFRPRRPQVAKEPSPAETLLERQHADALAALDQALDEHLLSKEALCTQTPEATKPSTPDSPTLPTSPPTPE